MFKKDNIPLNPITNIFDIEFGHTKSVNTKDSVDVNGDPIPWYTYPAIEYLNNLDFKNMTVFEYGSGNSSVYWGKKSKSTVSVEIDEKWYNLVRSKVSKKQTLMFESKKEDYVNSISKTKRKYDIVVIDGIYRMDCAKVSVKKISRDGIIILDNSDWYTKTAKFLRDHGFAQIDFSGFGPINYYTWTTSLFIKNIKSLKYINRRVRKPIIGGQIVTPKDDK